MANGRAEARLASALRVQRSPRFSRKLSRTTRAHIRLRGGAVWSGRLRLADCDEDRRRPWRERPRQGSSRASFDIGSGVAHAMVPAVTATAWAAKSAALLRQCACPRCRTSSPPIPCALTVVRARRAPHLVLTQRTARGPGQPRFHRSSPRSSSAVRDQATSTRGERCRYCRESSTHSTRP
jgi:hypothetical protein